MNHIDDRAVRDEVLHLMDDHDRKPLKSTVLSQMSHEHNRAVAGNVTREPRTHGHQKGPLPVRSQALAAANTRQRVVTRAWAD